MTDAHILQLFGLIYIGTGLGFFLNPGLDKQLLVDMFKHPAFRWILAIVGIVVGFLLVTSPSRSNEGWSLLITIIGWIALVKGTFLLVYPKLFDWNEDLFQKHPVLLTVARYLLVGSGVFMTYLGFYVL